MTLRLSPELQLAMTILQSSHAEIVRRLPQWLAAHPAVRVVREGNLSGDDVDVRVESNEGTLRVVANDRGLPLLEVDGAHPEALAGTRLLEALEIRAKCLVGAVEQLVADDPSFFDKGGRPAWRTLIDDAAQHMGVHPSTLNRACMGKTVQTPHGVFLLDELWFRGSLEEAFVTEDGRVVIPSVDEGVAPRTFEPGKPRKGR